VASVFNWLKEILGIEKETLLDLNFPCHKTYGKDRKGEVLSMVSFFL